MGDVYDSSFVVPYRVENVYGLGVVGPPAISPEEEEKEEEKEKVEETNQSQNQVQETTPPPEENNQENINPIVPENQRQEIKAEDLDEGLGNHVDIVV